MKKALFTLLLLALAVAQPAQGQTQTSKKKKISNRYSMTLSPQEDGSYQLATPERYKFINLDSVPDLLTVYEHRPIAPSKLYKHCISEEYVYKRYPGYELKLDIDRAVSDSPAPFVVYIHGGGWRTGGKHVLRATSQYLAVQKGIAGVRISYTLAEQPNAKIEISMEDIRDAVKWVQEHAEELNIDPTRFGFCGNSAGGHLSAASALTIEGTKAMVGYAGVYNLETVGNSVVRTKDGKCDAYFHNLKPRILKKYSPVNMVPKSNIPASLLICGTGDAIVDYTQSVEYAEKLRERGGEVDLRIFPYYDHNLHSQRSDKGHEILLLTAEFFQKHLNE